MYTFDNDISQLANWIEKEVAFPGNIASGKRGTAARRVQEWLCLHNHQVSIDADFGGVTKDAVQDFQSASRLPVTGVVDEATHNKFVAPMLRTLSPKIKKNMSYSDTVIAYAKAHLKEHPLEVGGANRGPWVRMYMKGNEGKPWAWCAGFTTFCMQQACEMLNLPMPIKGSFSCDSLAAQAKSAGLFLRERDATASTVPAGSLFLVRRTSTDWTHVGLVTKAEASSFQTLEGNTNDDGDREGYEVCARRRGYGKKDFVVF
ncbi:peptidoglycan-binding domain-containing protein [uncultured Roseobacter sp.]|uniref:peptidoglycan-binding domain-containing protein n=1 Tax=uncultured Roseobacter sp. TaxID=114847 RepID=UPI00262F186F|nr:peptidoglycan-binding domain-containing protein [uncultured Roseobacter sp.]